MSLTLQDGRKSGRNNSQGSAATKMRENNVLKGRNRTEAEIRNAAVKNKKGGQKKTVKTRRFQSWSRNEDFRPVNPHRRLRERNRSS